MFQQKHEESEEKRRQSRRPSARLHVPAVVGRLDAHQFGDAVEVTDVAGCRGAAGDQVVEGSAEVDHHVAGWHFLQAVCGKLGHQKPHHVLSCHDTEEGLE